MNTLTDSVKIFAPSIAFEKVISRKSLHFLRALFFIVTVGFFSAALIFTYLIDNDSITYSLYGCVLIFLALWLEQVVLFAYHNSFFFKGLNSVVGLEDTATQGVTYEVAKVTLSGEEDISYAFCNSTFGAAVLLRAGILPERVVQFLQSPRPKISASVILLPTDRIFTLIDLGKHLLTHDSAFALLLKQEGVSPETYYGSLRWVIGAYHQEKRQLRWWSKDVLSKTNSIGREWTYGTAYLLQQFSRDIRTSAIFSTLTTHAMYAKEKVAEIEVSLTKATVSNVLIIGEAGVGKIDLVMEIERRIKNGTSLNAVAGKQIIVLDTNRLFATHKEKQDFEVTLLNLFDEAVRAGNIIIVIENLSVVLKEAEAMGVFIPELLDEYLASPLLSVIATDTPEGFHTFLETRGAFVRRFTEVLIEAPSATTTIQLLQGIAAQHESRYNTIFTYSSLEAIATAAERYIVEGVMPDRAVSLLIEVATLAGGQHESLISSDFVYKIISEKTGIPAGPIKEEERDLLLNLEETLHQQVIGQQQALAAIARTMRRARVGIQSAEKPIGSFLFLGPTGVGKTETAKALAKVFFGGEEKMQRLDMSEYSGADGLTRLIGDGTISGTLPDMLREHPYCVMLLDEFEKATRSVHDIFLQVLDEGVFTDARGHKVNARNCIIIATSNAGSQLIMRTVQQRKELSHLTQEIIDGVIRDGVFRPELINRFDSTIIFEPLTLEEQGNVAALMLSGLHARVQAQGYDVQVTKDLLDILVEKGYSPEFGARPMMRVLQNVVEEKVAEKIISGLVKSGDTIILQRSDFSEAELSV